MSASSIVALRLDHLDKTSQSLAITSPAISGHLRSAQHRLASGEGKPFTTPGHIRLCKACGSSLILGWNCEISRESKPKKKRTRQDRLQRKDGPKTIKLRCSRCDSVTMIESLKATVMQEQRSERKLPVNSKPAKAISPPPPTTTLDVPKVQPAETTPAASSAIKKRNRNKKASLQSMLESRKPTSQAKGFGLGLADFMTG